VIGVWTTASRQRVRIWDADRGKNVDSGPFRQVSRLGNPLVNEVLIPLGEKDRWNSLPPADDRKFARYVTRPELAGLLPALYPGVFPHLAALVKSRNPRSDLAAILLTGIPPGLIPGFQNHTGDVLADQLRLNTAIPPAASPSMPGLLGGDLAGFPNGRRVFDDVVTIELRAIAGVTYPLVKKSYKPDAAAGKVTDGVTPKDVKAPYLGHFPYLGVLTAASATRPDPLAPAGPPWPGLPGAGRARRPASRHGRVHSRRRMFPVSCIPPRRSSSVRQSKRLIIAVSPVQVRPPLLTRRPRRGYLG
jgi:Domain of unknown function (DUF4331)